jgi:hypothetical protein
MCGTACIAIRKPHLTRREPHLTSPSERGGIGETPSPLILGEPEGIRRFANVCPTLPLL